MGTKGPIVEVARVGGRAPEIELEMGTKGTIAIVEMAGVGGRARELGQEMGTKGTFAEVAGVGEDPPETSSCRFFLFFFTLSSSEEMVREMGSNGTLAAAAGVWRRAREMYLSSCGRAKPPLSGQRGASPASFSWT